MLLFEDYLFRYKLLQELYVYFILYLNINYLEYCWQKDIQ